MNSSTQIRGFHVIASIDHINASLIWDQGKCSRFNWLWFDVTTYLPYTDETSYENSLLVQQSGSLALSSMTHVMKSLTPNAKNIFILLTKHQLENKDNSTYIGMSIQDLYQRCREGFLVNSDLTLRAQLVEFKDHKLIKSKKSYDGIEHLMIPIDNATLTEFLEQHETS
ncbi:ORC2 [Mytilus edulis]|uniref:Origin recognition complex subunit 2 n=1 Tax=Mytilus edulis TaxID=6550 RepID=A0A8S3QBU1_MYTED|nr:ORC2 [Mytilus edulis]